MARTIHPTANGLARIEDLADGVVEEVTALLYARHPDWHDRYGTRGRDFCQEDLHYHLEYLRACLESGFAEPFAEYARWLASLPKGSPVALFFEDPAGVPELYSDEGKVAQILRNLVSNALKFTERGEVRVAARLDGVAVVFSVADTGIGGAAEDQGRIFEEYAQIDGPLQRRARGSGLGLPLSRRLAELLGGGVWVDNRPGAGSTFFVRIPVRYAGKEQVPPGISPDSR